MPKIRFRSLPVGPYSLAVSQSESTIEAQFGSIEKAPPDSEQRGQIGTATIEVNRDRGTAPAGFFFSIKTDGWSNGRDDFDPYYDLHYRWTFNDPGHYTRHDTDDLPWGRWYDVAGERVLINDVSVPKGDGDVTFLGNDKNIAFGPHCCHVFDPGHRGSFNRWAPGEIQRTCRVTCEIRMFPTDVKPLASPYVDVVIDHPDSIFMRTQTFCVSNGGVRHGDEPLRSPVYPTIDAAISAAKSSGQVNKRICLRRGETHAAHANNDMGSGTTKLMWGSYGPSPDAATIVIPDAVYSDGPFQSTLNRWGGDAIDRELIFTGISAITSYDPSDPDTQVNQPPPGIELRGGGYKTFWDVEMAGFYVAVSLWPSNDSKRDITFGNMLVRNYFNYGMFLEGVDRLGFCGAAIKQHPKTVSNEIGINKIASSPPFTVAHAPIRVANPVGPTAFNLFDVRAMGGNSGIFQPTFRHYPGNDPDRIESVFDRMRAEGSPAINSLTGGAWNDPTNRGFKGALGPNKMLFDKLYQVVNHFGGASAGFKIGLTGPAVRNAIFVSPSTPYYIPPTSNMEDAGASQAGNQFFTFLEKQGRALWSDDIAEFPLLIYNNTFLQLREAGVEDGQDNLFRLPWQPELQSTARFQNNISAFPKGSIYYSNNPAFEYLGETSNYMWVPDKDVIGDDWLDLTPLWAPAIKGHWYYPWYQNDPDPDVSFNPIFGTSDTDAPVARPVAGSPLAGGADTSKRVAVDDFFGWIRGANPSRGAMEPL